MNINILAQGISSCLTFLRRLFALRPVTAERQILFGIGRFIVKATRKWLLDRYLYEDSAIWLPG